MVGHSIRKFREPLCHEDAEAGGYRHLVDFGPRIAKEAQPAVLDAAFGGSSRVANIHSPFYVTGRRPRQPQHGRLSLVPDDEKAGQLGVAGVRCRHVWKAVERANTPRVAGPQRDAPPSDCAATDGLLLESVMPAAPCGQLPSLYLDGRGRGRSLHPPGRCARLLPWLRERNRDQCPTTGHAFIRRISPLVRKSIIRIMPRRYIT